jgi:dephospho-CoA kinase
MAPSRIGLTGGIGSGKSAVAQALVRYGAQLIDADAIAQSVTAPGGAAIAAIAQAFGADFITPEGALDRQRMRALVFGDRQAKQRLEHIVHPLVGLETERQATLATAAGAPCLVFDVPLLVESGRWRTQLDRVLVVDCLPETQVARVMARNGLSRDAVLAIVAAQATRAQRLAAADMVLFNEAISLDDLSALVRQLSPAFGLSSGASA